VDSEPQSIELSPAQRRRLRRTLRQGQDGMALRAIILLWSAEGESANSIAQALGVSSRSVYRCRNRWRLLGFKGLADASRPGRPARVTASYLKLLMEVVEHDPRNLGFAFSGWTRARLAAYLQQRTGVGLSTRWVGELLRCHGFVWRRAKLTTRHLADSEEKTARRSAPASAPEGGQLAAGALRAVVRRLDPIRVIAGRILDVASPRHPHVGEDSGPERPSRRLRSHSLSHSTVPLHTPTQKRHHGAVPAAARAAGTTSPAYRATTRTRARQRRALQLPAVSGRPRRGQSLRALLPVTEVHLRDPELD
jgi:transposase